MLNKDYKEMLQTLLENNVKFIKTKQNTLYSWDPAINDNSYITSISDKLLTGNYYYKFESDSYQL